MNTEVFYSYISKTFYPWLLQNKIYPPVILFVDGHVSHRSLKLTEFCHEKQIVLVSFLPNTTHMCQPMDVVVFGPIKRKWSSNLQKFKIESRGEERMSKVTFCDMLKRCLDESFTISNLQSAFSKTALYPFSADCFDFSQLPASNSESSADVANDVLPSEIVWSDQALVQLEQMIGSTFPNRIAEFKNTFGDWTGPVEAIDLFTLWQTICTSQMDNRHEVGDFTRPDESIIPSNSTCHTQTDDESEDFELMDVIYSDDNKSYI